VQAISLGEVLWDVIGDAEHLGGAPFNFALNLRNLGHSVHFVSAVGSDERGHKVLSRMQEMGLPTSHLHQLQDYPTGTASVLLDRTGQPRFVINHPAAYDFPLLSDSEAEQLCSRTPDLIYFGTLFQMSPPAREVTFRLLNRCPGAQRFYDVNLRVNSYEPDLVRELMSRATVVKVNDDEVTAITAMFSDRIESLEQFCRAYASKFGWQAVCVTRGEKGCVLLLDDSFVTSPGYQVPVIDTIGAGDAFAAAFAHGFVGRWPPDKIADFANRVGALVASRAGATPRWTIEEAAALQR
jgi:fructokinase